VVERMIVVRFEALIEDYLPPYGYHDLFLKGEILYKDE
jgi:hypothetical protein